MGEVLSQNEIDSLLQALSSGELDAEDMKVKDEKQVKNYDFTRPAKFSKEHLRTLEIIFEHYGRLLSTNLPVYLRKTVQVEVMNSEAVTYSEFTNALSNPVLLGLVNVSPLSGSIIIELADNLGYAIVDRMLGGLGTPLDKPRDFSEIELLILERIYNSITEATNQLKETQSVLTAETSSEWSLLMKPGILKAVIIGVCISPTEMIALVTLHIKIGDVEGLMNICLPYLTLESVMDKLNTKFWYSNLQEHDDKQYTDAIEALISKAKIPVKAVLGNSTISVDDFVNLQVGDIIRLDSGVNQDLNIFVGNIKKFTALPGAVGDNYAVRVTSVVREEQ